MKKVLACLLVLAVVGCQATWQKLDQAPAPFVQALEAARAVLARHYVVTNVDRVHGIVEASSLVRANIATKYRTKAVGRVFVGPTGAYGVEMRVTNEFEMSEPSLLGGGQPWHDWRAVGFDHLEEAALMAEVQAQLRGQVIRATPRSSHVMFLPRVPPFRPREIMRPNVPDPVGGAEKGAPAPKPPEAPKSDAAPKSNSAAAAGNLFEQYMANGDRLWQQRNLENALLEYQRAAVACPQSPLGHLSLVGVWTALRRYGAGAEALRQAAAVANGQRLSGKELARLGGPAEELGERLLVLKGWCKQRPDDYDGRLLLAYHYWLAGRADDARASAAELLQAKPQDAAARFLAQQTGAARS